MPISTHPIRMADLLGVPRHRADAKSRDWSADPCGFMADVLGEQAPVHYGLYDKQTEIAEAVRDNRRVAVAGANGTGKDWLSGRLILWWLKSHDKAKCIVIGPCFDDQTETLTNQGWRRFAQLDHSEKVASLVNGKLQFVTPSDWIKEPYTGPMVGYKSQALDFLVTPNHKLWARPKWSEKFRLVPAQEIYGRGDWIFTQQVRHRGKATRHSEDAYALWGFWFADGYSQAGQDSFGHWRYRVTLTQKKYSDYARWLFQWVYPSKKVKEDARPKGGYNFTIQDKALASWFEAQFKIEGKRRIPRWVKSASRSQLRAFLHGYMMGDGSFKKDSNSQERIRVYDNLALADDLHEIAILAGYRTTIQHRLYKNGAQTESTISFWVRKGPWLRAEKWYEVRYSGHIYCVTVPSGVVLVRRNGIAHWSGNTHRQVAEIVWREARIGYENAITPLGGKMLPQAPHWELSDDSFALGFATDDPYNIQGFHSPHLMVIISEAHGVGQQHIEAVKRLNPERLLLTGNPLSMAGEFYDAFHANSEGWRTMSISAFDTPNVQQRRLLVPGMVTQEDVEERKVEWGEDSPLYQSGVLGQFPSSLENTLISRAMVDAAIKADLMPKFVDADAEKAWQLVNPVLIACDVARFGSDRTVVYRRQGPIARRIWRVQGQDTMQIAGWLKGYKADHPEVPRVVVDDTGVGGGVTDRLREQGVSVVAFTAGESASDKERYANATAEAWSLMARAFKDGQISIENDPALVGQLCTRQYKLQSDRRIILESKADLKARGGKSPDEADALAMTYSLLANRRVWIRE